MVTDAFFCGKCHRRTIPQVYETLNLERQLVTIKCYNCNSPQKIFLRPVLNKSKMELCE